jgi:curved DNA-binding protein CbpA
MRQRPFHERYPDVDLYAWLGVARDATPGVIRKAYRAKASELHPDRYEKQDDDVRSTADHWMKILNEALEVLGDETRRRVYDEHHHARFRGRRRSSGKTRRSGSKPRTPRASDRSRPSPEVQAAIRAAEAGLGRGPPGMAQFERCRCLETGGATAQWCECGFVAKDPVQAVQLLHFHGHHRCRACVAYWLGQQGPARR